MPPLKKKKRAELPAALRWGFGPDVPTLDFFEGASLDDTWRLQEAVDNFVGDLERDRFLTWEAVVCHEQGLPLTDEQEQAIEGLINFGDPDDDQVLYIDGLQRPSEPCYVILNRLAPHLLVEPFITSDVPDEVFSVGWPRIMAALEKHGRELSLPPGVTSVSDVVRAELRHRLWLQHCCDILGGLGQAGGLHLDEEETWRIDELIVRLREHKESVAFLGLTLESLLTRVILPEQDRPMFLNLMQQRLGLSSAQEPLADRL
jgi:hypothetical protein